MVWQIERLVETWIVVVLVGVVVGVVEIVCLMSGRQSRPPVVTGVHGSPRMFERWRSDVVDCKRASNVRG